MANKDLNIVLGIDTKQLDKALGKAQRKLNSFAFKAQNIGSTLTQSLTLPIIGVGAAAVKSFADFDKMRKGLEAVAGGAEEAEKQMSRLKVVALNPGISLQQAVQGTIRLQAVGLQAREAEETLLQFSKAVTLAGGNADDLGEVTRQLGQMISKGKILSSDFKVIQERVPAIGLALEDAFGTQNIEQIRETGISSRDFVDQLTKAISQNEKFQSVQGGLANSFDNFRQAVTASLVELGDSINKSLDLEKVLANLSNRIQGAVDAFASLDDGTKKIIVKMAVFTAALGPAFFAIGKLVQVGGSFLSAARLLLPAIGALASPIGLIVAAAAALAAGFAILYKRNEKFRTAVNKVATVIRAYVISAFQVLKQIVLVLYEGWKSQITIVKAVINTFLNVGKSILDTARKVPILNKGIELTRKAFEFVGETIKNSFIILPAIFAGIAAEAESLGQKIINFFKRIGVNAEILALQIKRGLTIDGTARDSLKREIDALKSQKNELAQVGEDFGIAFKRAFDEALTGTAGAAGSVAGKKPGAIPSSSNIPTIPTNNTPGGGSGLDLSGVSSGVSGLGFISAPIREEVDAANRSFSELKDIIAANEAERLNWTRGLSDTEIGISRVTEQNNRWRESTELQIEEQRKLNAVLEAQAVVGQYLQNTMTAFGDAFGVIWEGTQDAAAAIKEFEKKAVESIINIINYLIKEAVTAAIANTAIAGGPLGVALAAGAAGLITGIIKGSLSKAPRLAQGGIVPPGYPNDTYPAFLSSGETVVPPGKLPNLGGGGGYIAETRIDMRELIIGLRREETNLGRIE
jgi:tape measure domain-containing protein